MTTRQSLISRIRVVGSGLKRIVLRLGILPARLRPEPDLWRRSSSSTPAGRYALTLIEAMPLKEDRVENRHVAGIPRRNVFWV